MGLGDQERNVAAGVDTPATEAEVGQAWAKALAEFGLVDVAKTEADKTFRLGWQSFINSYLYMLSLLLARDSLVDASEQEQRAYAQQLHAALQPEAESTTTQDSTAVGEFDQQIIAAFRSTMEAQKVVLATTEVGRTNFETVALLMIKQIRRNKRMKGTIQRVIERQPVRAAASRRRTQNRESR